MPIKVIKAANRAAGTNAVPVVNAKTEAEIYADESARVTEALKELALRKETERREFIKRWGLGW